MKPTLLKGKRMSHNGISYGFMEEDVKLAVAFFNRYKRSTNLLKEEQPMLFYEYKKHLISINRKPCVTIYRDWLFNKTFEDVITK